MTSAREQALTARLAVQNAHIASFIQRNPVELLDYETLGQHLGALPFKEESGLNWCDAILTRYRIGGLLNEPETSFAEQAMRYLLGLQFFTRDNSRGALRRVRKMYGSVAPLSDGYADEAWYRYQVQSP